jgi:hypothetical protein
MISDVERFSILHPTLGKDHLALVQGSGVAVQFVLNPTISLA